MLREDEIGGTALQGLWYYGCRILAVTPPQAAYIWIVMFAYKESKFRESSNKRIASINDVNGSNVINIVSLTTLFTLMITLMTLFPLMTLVPININDTIAVN
jgi:hypothetical protein